LIGRNHGRRSAAKLLSKDEARQIAANIAKLPPFIRSCGTRRRDEAPEIRYEHFDVLGNTDMVVAIG